MLMFFQKRFWKEITIPRAKKEVQRYVNRVSTALRIVFV